MMLTVLIIVGLTILLFWLVNRDAEANAQAFADALPNSWSLRQHTQSTERARSWPTYKWYFARFKRDNEEVTS